MDARVWYDARRDTFGQPDNQRLTWSAGADGTTQAELLNGRTANSPTPTTTDGRREGSIQPNRKCEKIK